MTELFGVVYEGRNLNLFFISKSATVMATANKILLPIGSCVITNGPSKHDFQMSQFEGKTVQFSINTNGSANAMNIGEKFNVTVHMSGREDGSNESFVGEFYVKSLTTPIISEKRAFYYNTRTRKGCVMEAGKKWRLITE